MKPMDRTQRAVARLENWLRKNRPEIVHALAPPATEQQLEGAERRLGFRLPEAIRVLWSLHNGSRGKAVIGRRRLLDVDDGVFETGNVRIYVEITRQSSADWLSAGVTDAEILSNAWIGFAAHGRDYLVVCAESGRVFEASKDMPAIRLAADSLDAFLERYAWQLEAGTYVYRVGRFEPLSSPRNEALAMRFVSALQSKGWLVLSQQPDAPYAAMERVAQLVRSIGIADAGSGIADVLLECDDVEELFANDQQLGHLWTSVVALTPT